MTDQFLLAPKFQIPAARGQSLPRPGLLARLDTAHPLTVLTAPPGYGKTSLLATWAAATTRRVAWLTFDADDNIPVRFWLSLYTALAAVIPEFPQPTEPFSGHLLNALHTAPSLSLIFDNFHALQNLTCHEHIRFLIEHLPAHIHLILSTHLPPPLPLSRWRARGVLTELTYTDLRLSPEEISNILAHEHVQSLYNATEGWLAGLQIAKTLPADQLSGAHPHFAQYFEEEVLPLISPTTQAALKNLSILDVISPALGELLTGLPASEVEYILKNTPFVFEYNPLSYRIHPLFRDYLLEQLHRQAPTCAVELHRRAGHHLQNDPAQALPHAFAAQALEDAARLLAQIAPHLLKSGRWQQLRQWLAQIPESLIETHPRLWITRFWLALETYQQDTIQPYLDRFDYLLSQSLPQPLQCELFAVRAIAYAMRNQSEIALTYARQAEAIWTEGDPITGTYVAFALAGAYKMGGVIIQAEHWFRQTLALAETSQNAYLAFSAHENLSDMLYQQARLPEAHLHALRAIKYATVEGLEAPFTGWMRGILGLIAFAWNELETAQTEAARSLEICQKWDNAVIQVPVLNLLAQIYQLRRDFSQAAQALEQADTCARKTGEIRFSRPVIRQRILLSLREKNLDAARRWWTALNALPPDETVPSKYHHTLIAARLHLAEGQPRHALKLLTAAAETFRNTNFVLLDLERHLLTALAHRALGKPDEAAHALEKALHLAAPGKIQHPFLQSGAPMRELLRRLAAHSAHAFFIGTLLTAFGERAAEETGDLTLTPREAQILRLLAAGFSNRDMAEELIIAESTLKRHIANLYLKMGVHSRTQALACAQEFHLL